jgi:hypothetical protein
VHAGGALQVIPDYQSALDRLIALKPELLAPKPQRTPCDAGYWVFNRTDFITGIEKHGYRLLFSADHDLKLTHKNAPGPSVYGSMVFGLQSK